MNIPVNTFIYINILVGIIYLVFIIKAYKDGFIYELLNLIFLLVSFYVSLIVAPIFASKLTIFDLADKVGPLIDVSNVTLLINSAIWFVFIVLILNLLFLLIKPIFKFLTKIPLIGPVNKLLGIVIGVINATIITMLLSVLLTFPIFQNGGQVKDNTVLKYIDSLSSTATKFIINNIDLSKIQEKVGDFDIEDTREALTTWLIDQGVINE